MAARGILMAIALSALLPVVTAARGYPTPSAETVRELRRHHHHSDWWRITTDSGRYEARVSVVDAEGLAGLTTAHKTPPAPERIAWESIVRIDLKKTHETRGKITGMLLGLFAGFIPLAVENANNTQPGYWMLAGAGAGFYVGGRVGASNVHERPLYVAPTPLAPPAVPVAARATARPETAPVVLPSGAVVVTSIDSTATDTTVATSAAASAASVPPAVAAPAAAAAGTAQPVATSPEIERACGRLSSGNLLQIEGDFGTFCGYAANIEPKGLTGLRVETTRASVQSPGSLGWERVERIDVYGNNAGRGALAGAISFGVLGGLIGIPIGQVLAGNGNDGGSGAWGITLACAGVSAGFEMVLGTLTGALSSGWHLVYRRQ